jgi:hypothetical protein
LISEASAPKLSPPHEALGYAARQHRLEETPEQIALTEPSVPVLREGRMVGHRVGQVEPTEPTIRQVQMNLLAKPPFRPDTEDVTDDQHADHQLGIYRWPPRRAVERREMVAHVTEIDETVDAPEQMIRRDMVFYCELVEQRALRNLPRPHHRQFSHASGEVNQQPSHRSSGVFQHHLRTSAIRGSRSEGPLSAQAETSHHGPHRKTLNRADNLDKIAKVCLDGANHDQGSQTIDRPAFVFSRYCEKIGPLAAPIARALPPTVPTSTVGAIKPRLSWFTR